MIQALEYALERHSCVHRNETRNSTDSERYAAREGCPLTQAHVALDELLERRVGCESHSRVSTLTHHLRVHIKLITRAPV